MSQKSIPAKLTVAESFERSKNVVCELKECCSKKKTVLSEKMEKTKEIAIKATKIHETQRAKSTKGDKDDKAIPTKATEENPVKNIKLTEAPEATKVREALKKESPKDIKLETPAEIPKITKILEIKDDKLAIPTKDSEESYGKNTKPVEVLEVIKAHETLKKESPKDIEDKDDRLKILPELKSLILESLSLSTGVLETLKTESTDCETVKDNSSEISPEDPEENNVKDIKPAEDKKKTKKIPVLRKDLLNPWDLGARKIWRPISKPNLDESPLILAIHLVPSLPIELFEVFAEIIEVVTKKPVVLLYETRFGRPVAKDVVDIAILPAADDWNDGVLLPVSFVFEHHLNKSNSPHVYVDVILADDRAPHVENIMDLRGHRCAIPNRCDKICATSLLFNYLRTRGENPAFFGNILDGNSQLDVLRMVVGKPAEVGVVDAPVIRCHKMNIIGAEFLQILASLGPLPPYRIMINKVLDVLAKELTTYLLNINQHKEWMDRLSFFGIIGFAENSLDFYNLDDVKSVATSVPYY
ncbi:uncharacterized protein [Polyergus mexicanus]|uniref:uncharacterized protein isoform X2 n=1 Tax=Polyergus mexicanus TaxID=615972 RepID=UPI0038B46658